MSRGLMPGDMKIAQEAWGPASLETWGTSRNETSPQKQGGRWEPIPHVHSNSYALYMLVCVHAHAAVRSRMVAHIHDLSTGEVAAR